MSTQRIIASVNFSTQHGTPGQFGFDEDYVPSKSIETYIQEFEEQTMRMQNAAMATTVLLEITEHEEDGSFKYDKYEQRVTKRIYLNEAWAKLLN